MYIELIDLLRCPELHEESWLVAAFNRMDGRFIIDGKLGCPVCSAAYPISEGVADFRAEASGLVRDAGLEPSGADDSDEATRAAAMLGLIRPGSVAVLSGMRAAIAGQVAAMASARVVAVNPAAFPGEEKENVAVVLSNGRLPLASGSVDGMMLGEDASGDTVREAVRVLKTGGRLVVSAGIALGGNLRELARDDRFVVAESTGPLLGLSR